jgi:Na+/proline symporter
MLSFNVIIAACLLYVVFLFLVAFAAEKGAKRGKTAWLRSPVVYTLSLSVYCTGWTFFGAVGYAARSGLEFVTIYLGPTLVLIGWFAMLRKLVRIGRTQRITSIADLISSRYGKSPMLGIFVTVLCVIAGTPYIALQLQSVTLAFRTFAPETAAAAVAGSLDPTAVWVAAGLALFTIIFGTRNLDVDEKHNGVVMAIAVEGVVKLVALVAVGWFVLFHVAGGPGAMIEMIEQSPIADWRLRPTDGSRSPSSRPRPSSACRGCSTSSWSRTRTKSISRPPPGPSRCISSSCRSSSSPSQWWGFP